MKIKWLIHIILCHILFSAYAYSSELTRLTISNALSTIKIEFSITEPASYHVFTLSQPDRLVIDFTETTLSEHLQYNTSHPDIIRVRSGYPNPSTLRIVFNLKYKPSFKSYSKPRPTIFIDKKVISTAVLPKPIPVIIPKLKQAIPAHPLSAKKQMIIVIDPGHGGKDPGTTGYYGTTEKDVVLSISKKLAELINRQSHVRAVLTRDHDYFLPLRTRLKLARKGKADLFIAIHADASEDKTSDGASIYALSEGAATKEARHWLNNSGNYFELNGVNMNALEDKSSTLRSVLIDLAQTATMNDSIRLGSNILKSIRTITPLHYKQVIQAPFMVLKSPDIPSILIETGYLSNPAEEKKLATFEYQNKIAQAIFNGISLYLKQYALAPL